MTDPVTGPVTDAMTTARVTAFVHGHVQGVGFRWWVRARALELGLVGHARNTMDDRVEVVAQGPDDAVARLAALPSGHPSTTRRPGRVPPVTTQWPHAREGVTGFVEK